ncbi:helix-turn-helix domain-containing protein [Saccharopolyspora pogona]|uniref:helix-turn-helix domain-containing protein n=1 Tax=Saccharopolyspora pogona TaxID=333966 RepID=UPI001685FAE4|nr:helix-turn-helix transcriptional regulator [Saccharopolyspora pogona]
MLYGMPTPTVRRLLVGHLLRHAREQTGLDLDAAGKLIGKTNSTMSRIERGQTALPQHVLKKLANAYEQHAPNAIDLDELLDLARGSQDRGRWSGYRSVYSKYFRMAVDLEADAAAIFQYQTEIVPGLLQTEQYIRALFTTSQVQPSDQSTEDAVEARLERQAVLAKPNAPQVSFVLSESSLRRLVGDRELMENQLRHTAEIARLRNVQIQVLPFDAATAPRATHDFKLFRVPSPGNGGPLEFVYVEDFTDGRYLDRHDDVHAYTLLWQQLVAAALDPVESEKFILRVADEFAR